MRKMLSIRIRIRVQKKSPSAVGIITPTTIQCPTEKKKGIEVIEFIVPEEQKKKQEQTAKKRVREKQEEEEEQRKQKREKNEKSARCGGIRCLSSCFRRRKRRNTNDLSLDKNQHQCLPRPEEVRAFQYRSKTASTDATSCF